MSVIPEDGQFQMKLSMEETDIFSKTHTHNNNQIIKWLYVNIISPHPWDKMKHFSPKWFKSLEEGFEVVQYVSDVVISHPEEEYEEEYFIFDLNKMNGKIHLINVKKEVMVLVSN